MKMILLILFMFTGLVFSSPTPRPIVATATGNMKFIWTPPAVPTGYRIIGFDFYEKIGTTYKWLGRSSLPQFVVRNIGSTQRTFGIVMLTDKGPGTIKEFVFPGIVNNLRGFVEVMVK